MDLTGKDALLKRAEDEIQWLRGRVLELEARVAQLVSEHREERVGLLNRIIPERKPQGESKPNSGQAPMTHFLNESPGISRPPIPQMDIAEAEAAIAKHIFVKAPKSNS